MYWLKEHIDLLMSMRPDKLLLREFDPHPLYFLIKKTHIFGHISPVAYYGLYQCCLGKWYPTKSKEWKLGFVSIKTGSKIYKMMGHPKLIGCHIHQWTYSLHRFNISSSFHEKKLRIFDMLFPFNALRTSRLCECCRRKMRRAIAREWIYEGEVSNTWSATSTWFSSTLTFTLNAEESGKCRLKPGWPK